MKLLLTIKKKLTKALVSRPAFHFEVEWGGFTAKFEEVTGLAKELEPEENKEGGPAQQQAATLNKFSTIKLKRGVVSSAHEFLKLKRKVRSPEKEREEMLVRLLDEKHRHVAAWRVTAAQPTKVQASDLKADGNEVATESIELTHEGLSLVKE